MSEDLLRIVAAEMRQASARTADCPHLIHRVAVGVERRRTRQRRFAVLLVAAAVAVTVPLVRTGSAGGDGHEVLAGGQPEQACASVTSSAVCNRLLSQRAQLALTRANPPTIVTASARDVRSAPSSACHHRPTCPV